MVALFVVEGVLLTVVVAVSLAVAVAVSVCDCVVPNAAVVSVAVSVAVLEAVPDVVAGETRGARPKSKLGLLPTLNVAEETVPFSMTSPRAASGFLGRVY